MNTMKNKPKKKKIMKIKFNRKINKENYSYSGTYSTKKKAQTRKNALKNTAGHKARVVTTKRVLKSGTGNSLGRFHVYSK
jgi:hypothetical protein